MQRIKELDGLRAVAILLVIGCHYPGFARLFWTVPSFGWIGVDIFFALSGYLITTVLLGMRGKATPYTTFYSRRLIRIVPPYAAATLLIIAIGLWSHKHWVLEWPFLGSQLLFLQAFHTLPFHSLRSFHAFPALLSNSRSLPATWIGADVSLRSTPKTYWSLSVEEYFYLLWAPIVLRCSTARIVAIAAAVCVVEAILRWYANTLFSTFGITYRFDALIYGALLALLFQRWRVRSIPVWAERALSLGLAAGAAGLCGIVVALHPALPFDPREVPLFMALGLPCISVATAAFMGLLIVRTGTDWLPARILRWRTLQSLGTISYTMYLVHLLALGVTVRIWNLVLPPNRGLPIQAVFGLLLTILTARLSWKLIEKPALRWKDSRFPNAPDPSEPSLS